MSTLTKLLTKLRLTKPTNDTTIHYYLYAQQDGTLKIDTVNTKQLPQTKKHPRYIAYLGKNIKPTELERLTKLLKITTKITYNT